MAEPRPENDLIEPTVYMITDAIMLVIAAAAVAVAMVGIMVCATSSRIWVRIFCACGSGLAIRDIRIRWWITY